MQASNLTDWDRPSLACSSPTGAPAFSESRQDWDWTDSIWRATPPTQTPTMGSREGNYNDHIIWIFQYPRSLNFNLYVRSRAGLIYSVLISRLNQFLTRVHFLSCSSSPEWMCTAGARRHCSGPHAIWRRLQNANLLTLFTGTHILLWHSERKFTGCDSHRILWNWKSNDDKFY